MAERNHIVIGWATEGSRPRADGLHEVTVSTQRSPPPSALERAKRIGRAAAIVCAAGMAVGALVVAAGLSKLAGRYSRATSAPSAQPSTRADREVRKAIRRSFIAAGLGEHDLKALRCAVQKTSLSVRAWRDVHRLESGRRRESAAAWIRTARTRAREAQLSYAAACAAAGAVPRGAR